MRNRSWQPQDRTLDLRGLFKDEYKEYISVDNPMTIPVIMFTFLSREACIGGNGKKKVLY